MHKNLINSIDNIKDLIRELAEMVELLSNYSICHSDIRQDNIYIKLKKVGNY